ncbi:MAG: glycosyl hydrolase family 28-related protein, partial [Terriglobales bacterium]
MVSPRREFLKNAGIGIGAAAAAGVPLAKAQSPSAPPTGGQYDVRGFGATGDGRTIDTPAVNRAIDTAAAAGGGTVRFPAGTYACY